MSGSEAPFAINFGTRPILGHLHTPTASQMGKHSVVSVELKAVWAPGSLEYRKSSCLWCDFSVILPVNMSLYRLTYPGSLQDVSGLGPAPVSTGLR